MKFKDAFIFWTSILFFTFLPGIITIFTSPSENDLVNDPFVELGTLTTKSNLEIKVNGLIGDVFKPKNKSSELGFDLVTVSCFFDPIRINNKDFLPLSPMLNSVLFNYHEAGELEIFSDYISKALYSNRDIFSCYLDPRIEIAKCEGDEFVPFVCSTVHHKAFFNQEIRNIAFLPLFNPDILQGRETPEKVRERLSDNIVKVIKRLSGDELRDMSPRIRSVGFAALGSTSINGGDSPYFLEFKDGFLAIIDGLQQSKSTESFDHAYFVGFEKHKNKFKEETVKGLVAVSNYLTFKLIFNPANMPLVAFLLMIFWLPLSMLNYQNWRKILNQNNRWDFIGKLLGVNVLFVGLSYYPLYFLVNNINPQNYSFIYVLNVLTTLLVVALIRFFGKQLSKTSNRH